MLNNKKTTFSRFFSLAAALTCAFLLFSGCGGGGTTTPTPPQTITVKGRVVAPYNSDRNFAAARPVEEADGLDLDGIPLSDATVSIAGTSVSATTDSMGNFTLSGAPANADIVITASKAGLVLYKGLKTGAADALVNINYQTTTAYQYYNNVKSTLPSYIDVEWIEKLASSGYYKLGQTAAAKFKEAAALYGTRQTTTPPHQNEEFTSEITADTDLIPPCVRDVDFSISTGAEGKTLTVTIQTYDTSDLYSLGITLQHEGDQSAWFNWFPGGGAAVRTISINEYLEGTPAVTRNGNIHTIVVSTLPPDGFPSGTYEIATLFLSDDSYNVAYYTSSPIFQLESDYYLLGDFDTVTITSQTEDDTPPVLVSATLSGNAINSETDEVTLRIEVGDDSSGVTGIAYLLNYPNNNGWEGSAVPINSDNYDAESGNYIFERTFDYNYFHATGTYDFSDIYVRDGASNVLHVQPGNLEFDVNTVPFTYFDDYNGIALDSLVITRSGADFPASIQVSITATHDEAPEYMGASGWLGTGSGSRRKRGSSYFSCKMVFSETTGEWACSDTIFLNDFVSDKALTLSSIYLYDDESRRRSYSCYEGECDGLTIQGVSIPAHDRADTTAPALASLDFSPKTVSIGQSLDVEVTATENGAGLKNMEIVFYKSDCSSSDQYPACRFNLTIDQFTYSGGAWRAAFSAPFMEKMEPGEWHIDWLQLTDFAGNYKFYDSDDLKPFTPDNSVDFTVE